MSKLVAKAKGLKVLDFLDFNSSETLSDFMARIALVFNSATVFCGNMYIDGYRWRYSLVFCGVATILCFTTSTSSFKKIWHPANVSTSSFRL